MPPAIAVPIALAGVSMIATNVQNKAAVKNNENQQAASVGNAQSAWQNAQAMLQKWMQANPAPFANAGGIARPTPYGSGGAPVPPGGIHTMPIGRTVESGMGPPGAAPTTPQPPLPPSSVPPQLQGPFPNGSSGMLPGPGRIPPGILQRMLPMLMQGGGGVH